MIMREYASNLEFRPQSNVKMNDSVKKSHRGKFVSVYSNCTAQYIAGIIHYFFLLIMCELYSLSRKSYHVCQTQTFLFVVSCTYLHLYVFYMLKFMII